MQYRVKACLCRRLFNSPRATFNSEGVWYNDTQSDNVKRHQWGTYVVTARDDVVCRSLSLFLSLRVHDSFGRRDWSSISTVFAKQAARVYRNT